MPKARNQKYDERISNRLVFAVSGTAKRYIQVVSEPARQGYVPATPELCNIPREIREFKVAQKFKSEQFCRS